MSVAIAEKKEDPFAFPCFDENVQDQVRDLGKNLGIRMAVKRKRKKNEKIISFEKTRIIFVNQSKQKLIDVELKEIVKLIHISKASPLTIAFVKHLSVYTKDMIIDDSNVSSLCIRIRFHQMDIDLGYMPTEPSVTDLVEKLNSTKKNWRKKWQLHLQPTMLIG